MIYHQKIKDNNQAAYSKNRQPIDLLYRCFLPNAKPIVNTKKQQSLNTGNQKILANPDKNIFFQKPQADFSGCTHINQQF